jgi:hypothetical protein
VVQSQSEAKRFLANKVIDQARSEGRPLSDDERQMLFFSESDPEFVVDVEMVNRLEAAIPEDEYEAKIAGLFERRFAVDLARDSAALETWRQARAVLSEGDHYLQIMLDRAIARKLKPWWQFWK